MTSVTPPAYIIQSDEQLDKAYDPKIVRGLLPFLKPYRLQSLLALILMAIATLTAVAGPYFIKVAIDEGITPGDLGVLRRTMLLYLLVASVQWITNYARILIMSRVGQYVLYDVRMKMFEHLQRLSLSFYSRYSVGRVITRVINDVGTLREFVTWAVTAIARDLFGLAGIIIAMLALDVRLSLLTFTVIPLMLAATVWFRNAARRNYRRVRAAISWVNSVLAENINGVRVVQAFSRQAHNYGRFRDQVNRYHLDTSMRAAGLAALFSPIVDVLGAIATAL
ncbi:MAG TPA: ABC transporter transmembrane domain-containing protein, partial [Anaerolineales bacterium]